MTDNETDFLHTSQDCVCIHVQPIMKPIPYIHLRTAFAYMYNRLWNRFLTYIARLLLHTCTTDYETDSLHTSQDCFCIHVQPIMKPIPYIHLRTAFAYMYNRLWNRFLTYISGLLLHTCTTDYETDSLHTSQDCFCIHVQPIMKPIPYIHLRTAFAYMYNRLWNRFLTYISGLLLHTCTTDYETDSLHTSQDCFCIHVQPIMKPIPYIHLRTAFAYMYNRLWNRFLTYISGLLLHTCTTDYETDSLHTSQDCFCIHVQPIMKPIPYIHLRTAFAYLYNR